MAIITFTNNNNPNPGLEHVLDQSGDIITTTATTFEIRNNNPGATNGFIFRLTGTGFEADSTPSTGTITGVTILDSTGNDQVATITGIANKSLPTFLNVLQTSGVIAALSNLLGGDHISFPAVPANNTYTGSNGNDQLTTFGTTGSFSSDTETLNGAAGSDLLVFRSATATLIGGTGNDTFLITSSVGSGFIGTGAIFAIHGSAANGTGGVGETDIVDIRAAAANLANTAVTNIDGLRFGSSAIDAAVTFQTNQIGGGLSSTLSVTGSAGVTANSVIIARSGAGAVNLNLSGWQFTNFSRTNQIVSVALTDLFGNDPLVADQVIGTSRIDFISTGKGNDTLRGGGGADNLDGGSGDDSFLFAANEAAGTESVLGGTGTDTIRIFGNNNFSNVAFDGIERVQFNSAAVVTFDRSFDGIELAFIGNAALNRVNVVLDRASTFNLDALTFQSWATTDVVAVTGSVRNDDVTGSAVNDILAGLAGRDLLAGNDGNDLIIGGEGVDILSGDGGNDNLSGGAGIDILDGGIGNDILNGASEADTIDGGAQNDTINGGAGSDRLDGGSGNDVLDGGTGADDMSGGIGNDIYRVDHVLDQVFEDAGGGTDTVIASKSFALTDDSEINLLRTTAPASTTPINLTGNSFGQTIQGNAAANLIAGKRGNDTLTGNRGNDFFLFDTPLSATTNRDRIADFVAANDTIRIDNDVFIGLAAGTLSAAAFRLGTVAADATDRIIYNKPTGALIFDFNGNAAGGAVQFATLTTKPTITNLDFVVI